MGTRLTADTAAAKDYKKAEKINGFKHDETKQYLQSSIVWMRRRW
jgi:hypothetical protein